MNIASADEDEDEEDFGWGEEDQEDDNDNDNGDYSGNDHGGSIFPPRSSSAAAPVTKPSLPSSPRGGPVGPAGGALEAMRPEPAAEADDDARVGPPLEAAVAKAVAGGVKTLASAAALAEISRLTAALRECEAERDCLADGGAGGSGGRIKSDGDKKTEEVRRGAKARVRDVISRHTACCQQGNFAQISRLYFGD